MRTVPIWKSGYKNVISLLLLWGFCGLVPRQLHAYPRIAGLKLHAEDWQKIEQNQVYTKLVRAPGATQARIYVIGYINAPRSQVWQAISDPAQLPQIYPEILELRVKNRQGNTQVRFARIDFPWPLEDRWATSRIVLNRAGWQQSWQRIAGSIKVDTGHWKLIERGGRTLMIYQTKFNPGIAMVPEWLINQVMQSNVPAVITNIRKHLNS